VAIAVNADSLATWLLPALAAASEQAAARVHFDLRRGDETQTAALLRDGTVMAAVTASGDPVPGCRVHSLGAMRYRPCASPAFVERWFPSGATPEELASAPVATFDRDDVIQDQYLSRRTRRSLDPPRHYVPGSGAFVQSVALGLGWGMLPDLQSETLLTRGELVVIDVQLHWQQWRISSTTLEQVAGAVRDAAERLLR
jgi:LysR family transcriptional regulator (chromosome initiation inhibitor)